MGSCALDRTRRTVPVARADLHCAEAGEARVELEAPPILNRAQELPRKHQDSASELAGRHPVAVGAVVLGTIGAGAAVFAGGAQLEQVTLAHEPAPNPDAAAGFIARANDVASTERSSAELRNDRRELYRTYATGGSGAIATRAATPISVSTQPIEREGGVTEYPPTTQSNGLKVYFLYGFGSSTFDQTMASVHRSTIDDDISAARAKGYTVIVDRAATRDDIGRAVYDQSTAGIVWVGHGAAGGYVGTSDGGFVRGANLEAASVSRNLKFVVLQACHSDEDPAWRTAFSTARVVTFHGKTRWAEVLDFNRPNGSIGDWMGGNPVELDDLIRDRL